MRRFAAVGAAALLVTLSAAPAGAITRPEADPAALPTNPGPSPSGMAQRTECATTMVIPGTSPGAQSPNAAMLNLAAAQRISKGEGQTVAVLDTGVKPGPRLPNVKPGGDYIEATDGLTDCDGHGTLVAGLIAGQPGDGAFTGVVPASELLSMRVASAAFSPRTPGEDPELTRASMSVGILARAIMHAADLGARVISISTITCLPLNKDVDQAALGAAIRYAAVDKDAVIVAAAGNLGGQSTGPGCQSNPLLPGRGEDPRNWAAVTSISIPSWWQPYVLSVGSLTATGDPSTYTMPGPWVGVAAPGENIVSVSNSPEGGLANGTLASDNVVRPISGTSFATAYVSGVVAMVRSRFPELSAAEAMNRVVATSHNAARLPSNLVGAGTVDPLAALTWEVPAVDAVPGTAATRQLSAPPEPAPKDSRPRTVAFAGAGVLALGVLIAAVLTARARRSRAE